MRKSHLSVGAVAGNHFLMVERTRCDYQAKRSHGGGDMPDLLWERMACAPVLYVYGFFACMESPFRPGAPGGRRPPLQGAEMNGGGAVADFIFEVERRRKVFFTKTGVNFYK
jgi:hypothetical protein